MPPLFPNDLAETTRTHMGAPSSRTNPLNPSTRIGSVHSLCPPGPFGAGLEFWFGMVWDPTNRTIGALRGSQGGRPPSDWPQRRHRCPGQPCRPTLAPRAEGMGLRMSKTFSLPSTPAIGPAHPPKLPKFGAFGDSQSGIPPNDRPHRRCRYSTQPSAPLLAQSAAPNISTLEISAVSVA